MTRDWQTLLNHSIPLTLAMQLQCATLLDGRISLIAPLQANRNDKGTAFGGSIATLATLAGWVEVQRQIDLAGMNEAVEIVIQRGETQYRLPIAEAFTATAVSPHPDDIARMLRVLKRKRLARLSLTVAVESAGLLCASFGADYVITLP